MFFWGFVLGVLGGYVFKPVIDRVVDYVKEAMSKKSDGDEDKEK